MSYQPKFDTTIRTQTTTNNLETVHVDYIDWDYPFEAACIESRVYGNPAEFAATQRGYLEQIDNALKADLPVMTSNYGGWPRIWQRVLDVGMVSKWPYWKPRPCVRIAGTLGSEWYDWASLTGVDSESLKSPK